MTFAFIFTLYLQNNGGDALRYWDLTADTSQNATTWMHYWGHRTYFVQWLNYIPSKVFGLNFLSGNFLYAAFSFLGIRVLFRATMSKLSDTKPTWLILFFTWILLFPNLHFWTAGIGKEALLFTALIVALDNFTKINKNLYLGILAILLAWWVRPISGAVLFFICFLSLISKKTKSVLRNIAILVFGLVGGFAVYRLTVMMHLESYTWNALIEFSKQQMNFLQNLQANSEIPMHDYNPLQRIYALLLRPDWSDVNNFWTFAAAVEHTCFSLLLIVALITFFKHKTIPIPKIILWGIFFGLGMTVIYAFTLNNLGIIMRMKSTYMIFFYIAASFVIFKKKLLTADRQ